MLLMTFDNLSVGPKRNSGDCLRNRRSSFGYRNFLAMLKSSGAPLFNLNIGRVFSEKQDGQKIAPTDRFSLHVYGAG